MTIATYHDLGDMGHPNNPHVDWAPRTFVSLCCGCCNDHDNNTFCETCGEDMPAYEMEVE